MDSAAAGWLAGPSLEPAGHLGSDFCFNFNLCFPCSFFFLLLFPVGSVVLASDNETATPLDAHSAPVKRDGMTVGAGAGQTWTRSHSV